MMRMCGVGWGGEKSTKSLEDNMELFGMLTHQGTVLH